MLLKIDPQTHQAERVFQKLDTLHNKYYIDINKIPPTHSRTRRPTGSIFTPEYRNIGNSCGNTGANEQVMSVEWSRRESLQENQILQNCIQQPIHLIPDIQEEAFETCNREEVNKLLEALDDNEFKHRMPLILADHLK
jgi:hypothetical protein